MELIIIALSIVIIVRGVHFSLDMYDKYRYYGQDK